jgi:hypothetical protein
MLDVSAFKTWLVLVDIHHTRGNSFLGLIRLISFVFIYLFVSPVWVGIHFCVILLDQVLCVQFLFLLLFFFIIYYYEPIHQSMLKLLHAMLP